MQYYDSHLPADTEMVTHLFKKFQKLFNRIPVSNGYRVPSEMTTSIVDNAPQQKNGYDCGLFVCQTMRALVLGLRLNFQQSMMPQIRANMMEPFRRYLESSSVSQADVCKHMVIRISGFKLDNVSETHPASTGHPVPIRCITINPNVIRELPGMYLISPQFISHLK
jgi:hypothetical protein